MNTNTNTVVRVEGPVDRTGTAPVVGRPDAPHHITAQRPGSDYRLDLWITADGKLDITIVDRYGGNPQPFGNLKTARGRVRRIKALLP